MWGIRNTLCLLLLSFVDGAENFSGFECEESNESSSSTDAEQQNTATESNTELFCLDYQADDKIVTSVIIHQVSLPLYQLCSPRADLNLWPGLCI